MAAYKPRRQSKRWLDEDCPPGVLAIYDHKQFGDRYTVFYTNPVCGTTYADMYIGFRAMSENPYHPQGIGIYDDMPAHKVANYRYASRHRAAKWSSLPDAVKRCVLQDLKEEEEARA